MAGTSSAPGRVRPGSGTSALGNRLDLLFVLATGTVLLLLVTRLQQQFLPEGMATQLGHNSETFMFALALAGGLLLAAASARTRRVLLAAALGCVALAGAVYYGDATTTVKTLNEPLLAAGAVMAYASLPRPLPLSRVAPWLLVGGLVLFAVVASGTALISTQAESVTALAAAPLLLDVFDRSILDAPSPTSGALPYFVMVLVLLPACALASGGFRDGSGALPGLVDYVARGAEGAWGVSLVCLFFVVRRTVTRRSASDPDDHDVA